MRLFAVLSWGWSVTRSRVACVEVAGVAGVAGVAWAGAVGAVVVVGLGRGLAQEEGIDPGAGEALLGGDFEELGVGGEAERVYAFFPFIDVARGGALLGLGFGSGVEGEEGVFGEARERLGEGAEGIFCICICICICIRIRGRKFVLRGLNLVIELIDLGDHDIEGVLALFAEGFSDELGGGDGEEPSERGVFAVAAGFGEGARAEVGGGGIELGIADGDEGFGADGLAPAFAFFLEDGLPGLDFLAEGEGEVGGLGVGGEGGLGVFEVVEEREERGAVGYFAHEDPAFTMEWVGPTVHHGEAGWQGARARGFWGRELLVIFGAPHIIEVLANSSEVN